MRILMIVTLISPLGEYGGPVRVVLNQAKELVARGHEVVVAAAAHGFGNAPPTSIDDVPVALFPARHIVPGTGFAGLAAPGLQRSLRRLTDGVDVVHIHAARDLVTLPAADWVRRHNIPYVLQTHGMIDRSSNPLARPLDAWLTRRVLRGASRIFHLTDRERNDLLGVGGPYLRLTELGNGVPVPTAVVPPRTSTEVLYLARLAPRKRPAMFVEMAVALAAAYPGVRFRLVGPDEGEGPKVTELIAAAQGSVDIRWEGPIAPDQSEQRMSLADIYVLPAVDEPYPMSVLEAMSLGIPVVITESCGLAHLVRDHRSGIVVDTSGAALTDAVRRLLNDEDLRRTLGAAGAELTRQTLGMAAVAQALETAYCI